MDIYIFEFMHVYVINQCGYWWLWIIIMNSFNERLERYLNFVWKCKLYILFISIQLWFSHRDRHWDMLQRKSNWNFVHVYKVKIRTYENLMLPSTILFTTAYFFLVWQDCSEIVPTVLLYTFSFYFNKITFLHYFFFYISIYRVLTLFFLCNKDLYKFVFKIYIKKNFYPA